MLFNNPKARKRLAFYQSLTDVNKIREVELYEQTTFDFWSRQTWCKFIYTYCDNEFNRNAGRVGRISSFRIGTRNLDLIPAGDRPKSRGSDKVKRYYDVSRAGTSVTKGITSGGIPGKVTSNAAQPGQWRSFRPSTFSIMIEIWSFERQAWTDKLEDFNIKEQTTG